MFVENKECFYIIQRIQSKKEINVFTEFVDSIHMLNKVFTELKKYIYL